MRFNLLKFKKISWKLTILYSLIFSIVLILLNAATLYGVKFFLIGQAEKQVNETSQVIESKIIGTSNDQTSLTDSELLSDQTALTDPELLSDVQSNPDINVKIADAKGKIVNALNNFNVNQININSNLNLTREIELGEEHLIIRNTKISNTGTVKAYLQVVRNMEKEYAFLKILFIVMAAADFVGIILSVLVGFIISRRILNPIDNITKTAKNISISDLNSRIEVGETDDELTRLAVTFNEMIERLKVSFEKQNQFVSDASHELRTPISVIQGYANLIDRWGKDDQKVLQESIEAIKNETSNMGELVERLLFLARGDIGRLKLSKENIKLAQLAEEVVKESRLIAPEHNLNFIVDESIEVNADRKMLKQMLRALVDNSIKFTPKGGKIGIFAELETNKVKIIVRDTGAGIHQNEIENIFNRFYRVDKARTKETGGSGLGLSIVKWIVDAHDGEIFVESTVGKGTSIIILLPRNLK